MDEIQPVTPRMGRATAHFNPAQPPGEGSNGQISLNFNYKVNFKDFIPNFVCAITNKRYKTYHTGLSFSFLDHASGMELVGAGSRA